MTPDPRVDVFRRIPCTLGEGALWHPERRSFWWVDIAAGEVLEARPEGDATRVLPVGDSPSALVPAAAGGLLVLRQSGLHRLDPDSGATTFLARPASHDPSYLRFNDAKCDPRGRLCAGSVALASRPGRARLYRFDPDRTIHTLRDQVSISNGLAWAPDGRTLYYIDSPTQVVQAFDYDLDSGAIGRPRVALDLRARPGVPDGCTIDAAGHLWIAHWGEGCVTHWDPVAARLLDTIRLPASQITNCALGGPRLDRLFITSAAIDLTEQQRRAEPSAGWVFQVDVETPGTPAVAFAG